MQLKSPKAPRSSRRQWAIAIIILLALAAAPRILNSDLVAQWLPQTQPTSDVVSVIGADGSITLVSRDLAWPSPSVATTDRRILPAKPNTSGDYRLLDVSDAKWFGARWSPCQPVSMVVNTMNAPKGFYKVVIATAKELQALTGLRIVVEGTSAEPASITREGFQPDNYGNRWAPVLISWADEGTVAALSGNTVGLASPYSVTVNGFERYYVSGHVVLDLATKPDVMPDGSPVYLAVLRHELGHVLGLAHVESVTQLMAPSMTDVSDFADGDMAGLAALGSGPCSRGI